MALLTAGLTQGQDIHFSQYNASPLLLNPAMAGNFNCDFRGGLNYRNQWNSVASPFVTYSAFFDMPLSMIQVGEGDVLGAGIALFNDRSGEGTFSNLSATLSAAYHKSLGDAHRVSLGVGLGFQQKRLETADLLWGSQWTGDSFDPTAASGENFNGNSLGNFNLDVGLMYKGAFLDGDLILEGGGTIAHLTRQKENFLSTGGENRLGMRYLGHLRTIYSINDKFSVMPTFLFQTQSAAQEFVLGSDFGYLLESGAFQAQVFLGAHYRLDDAVIPTLGLDYKNFRVGFSYDVTTSSLSDAASGVGGFEISLVYRACQLPVIPKEYQMPCPRY